MADSEQLLRQLVAQLKVTDPTAFLTFPGEEAALLRQLLRRTRQRAENRLTRNDMAERSRLLDEICQREAAWVLHQFDRWCYRLRLLDASKQLDVFHALLTQDADFLPAIRQRARHVLVDDWDETTPAQQTFIHALEPVSLVATCDPDGGSRRGYLNAFPIGWRQLVTDRPGQRKQLGREDVWHQAACHLLAAWKTGWPAPQSSNGPDKSIKPLNLRLQECDTWLDQLNALTEHVRRWLADGVTTGEIAIAAPILNPLIRYQLGQALHGLPCQWLSGTELPYQHPLVRVWVLLLQWVYAERWQWPLTRLELRSILRFWDLDAHPAADAWLQQVSAGDVTPDTSPELVTLFPDRLHAWLNWRETHQADSMDRLMLGVFQAWIAPFVPIAEPLGLFTRLFDRYEAQSRILAALQVAEPERQWLTQLKHGQVSDTPAVPVQVLPDHLVIGTPQKLIDLQCRRPSMIWLDVSNEDWCRTDNAPLYHAWVHSAWWRHDLLPSLAPPDTPDLEDWLVRVRAGHISRSLLLLVQQQLVCLSSEGDARLRANTGRLLQLLPRTAEVWPSADADAAPGFSLRPDQQPILDYKQGTMAVTAVPGAGKTFVTVALIVRLIREQGIAPERILVLTYMDSAVKTLQRRLRPYLPTGMLPVVSTIHSLAYRILRPGDHATRLGHLPERFDILDDFRQDQLLNQVAEATLPPNTSPEAWASTVKTGLSRLKDRGGTLSDVADYLQQCPEDERMREFYPAAAEYEARCRTDQLLDFTDLIRLAIQLLEQAPEVRAAYQAQFQVIIEDEAQDSSALLQRLIGLLGGDRPNLVRTGDANQSITTTFSSADPKVFRRFIADAETVVTMEGSGRCASEIMAFANQWMATCQQTPDLADAFQPVTMRPVPGVNPALLRPIRVACFQTEAEELAALARDIQTALMETPEASKAVLLRENHQVLRVAEHLEAAGLPAVTSLEPNGWRMVTDVIFTWLGLLVHPEQPAQLGLFLKAYAALGDEHQAQVDSLLTAMDPNRPTPVSALQAIRHPLAQQLYYDWLDFSRDIDQPPPDCWLVRMADCLLPSDVRLVIRQLSQLAAPHLAWQAEPVLWLLNNRIELERQLLSNLRRVVAPQAEPGVVQVMNLHQSKGQEFDWVWIPSMTANSFPWDRATLKQKEQERRALDRTRLELTIQRMLHPAKPPFAVLETELCQAKLAEEARLVYVGLTRARQALWCSAHTSTLSRYGKPVPRQPTLLVSSNVASNTMVE